LLQSLFNVPLVVHQLSNKAMQKISAKFSKGPCGNSGITGARGESLVCLP